MEDIADVQEIVQRAVDQLGVELSGEAAESAERIAADMLKAAQDITSEELKAMAQAIYYGAQVDEQAVVDRILRRIKEALDSIIAQVEEEEIQAEEEQKSIVTGEVLIPRHGYEGRI